jgi:hypothetical protein
MSTENHLEVHMERPMVDPGDLQATHATIHEVLVRVGRIHSIVAILAISLVTERSR